VLDVRAPTRPDLTTGLAKDVDFRLVDISDREQVQAAFSASWPLAASDPDGDPGPIDNLDGRGRQGPQPEGTSTARAVSAEITVFHTAANIRFFERDPRLLHLSDKVNVEGTQNVLDAARDAGVSVLIYTSSGSVSIHRTRLWLWPWEKRPPSAVQTFDDVDSRLPRRHEEMFSNYAASKIKAERLVRAADRTPLAGSAEGRMGRGRARPQLLRTGCLRPGNGIFGTGGDILCGAYLARQVNPSWAHDSLQNFIYVENASLAHFCYERRLIEKAQGSPNPDIGGQAFGIVDAGPPLTCGDVYTVLTTLTDGRTVFPRLSATACSRSPTYSRDYTSYGLSLRPRRTLSSVASDSLSQPPRGISSTSSPRYSSLPWYTSFGTIRVLGRLRREAVLATNRNGRHSLRCASWWQSTRKRMAGLKQGR